MKVHSFAPVSAEDAHTLILGSMPGRASLAANEYYAHPRNAFWKIMESLLGIDPQDAYPRRLRGLTDRGIALWDVMKACTRSSSLDADIVEDSIVPNDFAAFFVAHPGITRVYFNGAKAEHSFAKYVRAELGDADALRCARLPSTSPAHASLTLAQKIRAWRVVVP